MINRVTYRQQYTRCGKERCRKCKEGSGHGPYWYAYWSENGRTVSKYIGTRPPEDMTASSTTENGLTPSLESPEDASTRKNTPIVRIYLLGQFRIEHTNHHGQQIADSHTSHRKRIRALLGSLLSNPGRRIGREQVMEMLWPGLDLDLATNRLNGAVHELRQILEPDISRPSASRLLRLERDTFELADNSLIWVDAEVFEQLLKEAETCIDIQQAEKILEEAAALYQGSYLPEELYSEWAVPRRDALQRMWIDLQLRLTQIKVAQGAYVSAIESLDRLRTTDPTNETVLQQLMILLTRKERRAEALQLYKQYRTMLKRDYESQPLPETAKLYEELRRGQDIPSLLSAAGVRPLEDNKLLLPRGDPGSGVDLQMAVSSQLPAPPRDDQKERDEALSYTRPLFQPGHPHQSPLVGREEERQKMQQLLLTVEQEAGQQTSAKTETQHSPLTHFLLLTGEPGIGKTRMAEELGLEAFDRGWTVAWSRSYELESALPYHPWTEILRTLIGQEQALSLRETEALSPREIEALLPELADHAYPAQTSANVLDEHKCLYLWEAILKLLTEISKFHPLLLVFDDIHWADDSSIDLLTYLTHHLQGERILLIGTCRDGELAPQHKLRLLTADLQRKHAITMIPLHPLTPSEIGILISYLPEQLILNIQRQSSGNPLFAEELARFVYRQEADRHPVKQEQTDPFFLTKQTTQGELPSSVGTRTGLVPVPTDPVRSAQDTWSEPRTIPTDQTLPDAIAAVLERRLHRLSNECRTLLSRAAVLGASFELEQLVRMAPEHDDDATLDLLEEALHAGLLTEEEIAAHVVYHFWHPLIIRYLLSQLSATRRARLEQRAAALPPTIKSATPESNQPGRNKSRQEPTL